MTKNRMCLGLRMCCFLLLSGISLAAVVEAESFLPTDSTSTPSSSSGSGLPAQHATMTKEDLKLVKLLLKVQESYPNLKPEEQSKLVSKVRIFAEKLDQTLTKADSIPGKYGLDVEVLRKNLRTGPSVTSESEVEDEEDYEDEELEDDDDGKDEDENVIERSFYDGLPEDMDLNQAIEMIRDLSQQVRLLSHMIMTLGGAPHTQALPTYPHHYMPGGLPMAGYHHYPPPPHHHQQSVYATPYQAKAAKVGRKAAKRAMKVNAQMTKGFRHLETKKHLGSILEAIPAHFQDVDVNLNYIKKK